jgi:hypothetical protein
MGFDFSVFCSQSQSLGVVAGGMGGNTPIGFFIGERKNGVGCPTKFKSSNFLEILAFEEQFRLDHLIQAQTGQDRSPVDERSDP